MELMPDAQLLQAIEPGIAAVHAKHMTRKSAVMLDPVLTLSEAAHSIDATVATELGPTELDPILARRKEVAAASGGLVVARAMPFDMDGTADPLQYSPVLRESSNKNLQRYLDHGLDGRPIIGGSFYVNLLTEDNLPAYYGENMKLATFIETLQVWLNEWTTEEKGHSLLIRDYLLATGILGGLIAHDTYHEGHTAQARNKMPIEIMNAAQGFTYLAWQEDATYISHKNTAYLLDQGGLQVIRPLADQEAAHSGVYTQFLKLVLEVDPNAVVAIADQFRLDKFTMPGTNIPGFDALAVELATAGILDPEQLVRSRAKIISKLELDRYSFTSDEAKAARDQLITWQDPDVIAKEGRVKVMERHRHIEVNKAKKAGKLLPVILGVTVEVPKASRLKDPTQQIVFKNVA